jgi:hypothetical protein
VPNFKLIVYHNVYTGSPGANIQIRFFISCKGLHIPKGILREISCKFWTMFKEMGLQHDFSIGKKVRKTYIFCKEVVHGVSFLVSYLKMLGFKPFNESFHRVTKKFPSAAAHIVQVNLARIPTTLCNTLATS